MTIPLGRSICGDLAAAETREWLVTNGIGGYACGTVAGLLTRHYHGLLVAALKPPLGRTLLLTKLEETVEYQGCTVPLFTNRWADGEVAPHGYRYIERFELKGSVPMWTYAVDDALLTKQVWMQQGENTTYIQYDYPRGQGPLTLAIKVVVTHRDHHGGRVEAHWNITPCPNGIAVMANRDATPFHILSSQGRFTVDLNPFEGMDLAIERYRGTGDRDTYWQVAHLEVTLEPGECLTVVASTRPDPSLDGAAGLGDRRSYDQALLDAWQSAQTTTTPTPTWIQQLVLAADQFVVDRALPSSPLAADSKTINGKAPEMGKTIIAGYPWFGDWGRDTMISLPGLAIATGRPHLARPILRVFGQYLDQGMLPNMFPESNQTPHYNTVDATLWYFEAIRAYFTATQDTALLAELFPALAEVVDWHHRGTRYHIQVDTEDGLLYAGTSGVQLTWMDAKVGDWVVTPRIGKPVEINALWHNALRCMVQFAQALDRPYTDYQDQAERCAQGFQRFWSDRLGYCIDVLDTPDGTNDDALRPNQLFAVSLGWDPNTALLTPAQQKAVVDCSARELFTAYGMRSLSPHHPDYQGHYGGDQRQRDAAYHQGTVWSWLIGPFVHSHFKVYGNAAQARSWLAAMADHVNEGAVGSISEIFDGDPPFMPRGCFAQAWGVAEILRLWAMIARD